MPMPWEKKFWTGEKGGLDFWDTLTLGGSEIGQQLTGKDSVTDVIGEGLMTVTEPFTGTRAARAARQARNQQEALGREALDLQKEMFETGRQDMMPWLEVGREKLGTLSGMMDEGTFDPGEFKFGMQDFQQDPYYQFLQKEGARSVGRSGAGRGASGATLAGLQQRGMGLAAGEYGNQFNRALQTHGAQRGRLTDMYNRMAGVAGTGQTATSGLGQMGQRYGQTAGAGLQGLGNVRAAGIMGQQQARAQGMQNLLNLGGQLGSAYLASDIRLKQNVKYKKNENGFNLYEFEYKDLPGRKWEGVMAHEVEMSHPTAVATAPNGYKAVNYDEIGVELKEVK